VTAVDLWHLRPAFAIAIVLIALLAALAGWSGRGRRTAALLIALSVIALVVDALRVDGVATAYAAEPSPWVIVPVIAGLTAIASLLGLARRGRLSAR
jgi:predicted lysophospholipase L1 biosynthesis ABC-type transport system permease subunit